MKALLRIAAAAVATTFLAVACGGNAQPSSSATSSPMNNMPMSPAPAGSGAPASKAADLRTKLDLLLGLVFKKWSGGRDTI